jgi:hypothetical protein
VEVHPPNRDPPPPPSAALLDAVGRMKPVRTRAPWRSLGAVGSASLAYAALVLVLGRLRVDLPYLPAGWVVAAGAVWLAAFALPLAVMLVPRRGQVLPDAARVARITVGVAVGLILVSLLGSKGAPGHSLPSTGPALLPTVEHCLSRMLLFSIASFALALVVVRRLAWVGPLRLGAALGASGGALSGLMLHFLCPYASAIHVTLAHAGGVWMCTALGALVTPRLIEGQWKRGRVAK